jgi:transcriptional regulator with XRE-family HTH domain
MSEPKEQISFGDYVKNRRVKMKIKFNDLVEYLATTSTSLTFYMNNKQYPSDYRLSLLASVLETNPVYLFGLAGKIEPELRWKIISLSKSQPERLKQIIEEEYSKE